MTVAVVGPLVVGGDDEAVGDDSGHGGDEAPGGAEAVVVDGVVAAVGVVDLLAAVVAVDGACGAEVRLLEVVPGWGVHGKADAQLRHGAHYEAELVVEAGAGDSVAALQLDVGGGLLHLVVAVGHVGACHLLAPEGIALVGEVDDAEVHAPVEDVGDVAAQGDVVFVHCPLVDDAEVTGAGGACTELAVPVGLAVFLAGVDEV